jgi:alpha-2-macroglobulin
MSVAHAGARFGSGDTKLTVSKPLLLRTSLPRLARLGDRFQGGAVVHNYTASDAKVTIGLDTQGDGIRVEGDRQRVVTVGAGKAAEALWRCQATSMGKTVFRFRAAMGPETDGLERPVSVKRRSA